MRVGQSRGVRRREEVGGGVGVGHGGEAGRVRGRGVEGVQVGVKVRRHVAGGNGGGRRVLGVRTDQRRVPVNGESLVFIDDERALGAAASASAAARLQSRRNRLEYGPRVLGRVGFCRRPVDRRRGSVGAPGHFMPGHLGRGVGFGFGGLQLA